MTCFSDASSDERMSHGLWLNFFELVSLCNDLLNEQRDEPVRHAWIDIRADAFCNELLTLVRQPVGIPQGELLPLLDHSNLSRMYKAFAEQIDDFGVDLIDLDLQIPDFFHVVKIPP